MSYSEIFENYAKIMEEAGFVKKSEDNKKIKDLKSGKNPRLGSDDISTIEALYGLKPSSSIEYEHNIMEAAHPKPVVIAPSYDKIQGLVENENERQQIDINIVMKPTDGKLTNYKYAHKDLLMELVRVANDMDNRDLDNLRVLADACITSLAHELDGDAPGKEFEKFDDYEQCSLCGYDHSYDLPLLPTHEFERVKKLHLEDNKKNYPELNEFETCEDCGGKLLDVKDEIYCPKCDVGEEVKTDGPMEVSKCKGCGTKLAPWYPYEDCPSCLK